MSAWADGVSRLRPGPLDAAIAAALSVWTLVAILVRDSIAGPTAVVILLFLVPTVSLAWRRRAPLLVAFLVAFPPAVHAVAIGDPPEGGPGLVAVFIALYSVAAYCPWRRALLGLLIVAVAYVLHEVNNPNIQNEAQLWSALFAAAVTAGTFAAGAYVRRHRQARTLAERAHALELEGERRAQSAAADERARIARELHDIVSHNVSVMVLQAEAAEEVLERSPGEAGEPLRRIQRTGREALVEMRRMLGVLRADGPQADRAPQPGLAALPQLMSTLAEAGMPVCVRVEGAPVALAPGVDLAAYRVVQEALTNTLKHAGHANVQVTVRWNETTLELVVTDDGRAGGRDEGAGHGLAGMRERVEFYHGDLQAGPRAEGGYRVRACLPLN